MATIYLIWPMLLIGSIISAVVASVRYSHDKKSFASWWAFLILILISMAGMFVSGIGFGVGMLLENK